MDRREDIGFELLAWKSVKQSNVSIKSVKLRWKVNSPKLGHRSVVCMVSAEGEDIIRAILGTRSMWSLELRGFCRICG